MDKKTGFTKVPHSIGNGLLLLDLNARQLKVTWLIIRLTYGCNQKWAKIKLNDLKIVNIAPPHANKIITSLISEDIIIQNGRTKEFRLNEEYIAKEHHIQVNFRTDNLNRLIGKHLTKKIYQKGNQKVTELVIHELLEEEDFDYQKSNDEGLPIQEILDSQKGNLTPLKDILNKRLNKPIDNSIAFNNFSKNIEQRLTVHPNTFKPANSDEYTALEAWQRIEPQNPNSFPLYLSAIGRGLPSGLLLEFASEIEQDNSIKNRGAVFNKKVTDYLGGSR